MKKTTYNKRQKIERLLDASFELFTQQGINKTSISDIVEKAEVAKGTFYLYFKDKYDIKNKLIAYKTNQLFVRAYEALNETDIEMFEDKIIFIMNYVLDELNKNKGLVMFIHKDLSWAVFRRALESPIENSGVNFKEVYEEMLEKSKVKYKDPAIMLFLIIEIVGACGYSAIIYEDPVPFEELKSHLENSVRNIMKQYEIKD